MYFICMFICYKNTSINTNIKLLLDSSSLLKLESLMYITKTWTKLCEYLIPGVYSITWSGQRKPAWDIKLLLTKGPQRPLAIMVNAHYLNCILTHFSLSTGSAHALSGAMKCTLGLFHNKWLSAFCHINPRFCLLHFKC